MAILLNPTNVNIEINDDIGLMCISEEFSNHAPRETYLIQSQYEAARAFFQAERDEQLGWWRDTENMDMVVYPRSEHDDHYGRCILLLNETTGETSYEWERFATSGPGLRYFEAHPKPKPWDTAQPDEVWALTINNDREEVFRCGERGLYSLKTGNPIGSLLSCSHNKITAGRRIWPEGGDK